MKGHARVLRCALDEPVQRVSFLNFQLLIAHAFGGGIGRVLGQAGLNGSGLGFGWIGGAAGGCGVGAGWLGLVGGARGSVCGIEA